MVCFSSAEIVHDTTSILIEQVTSDRLRPTKMDLGLEIHGKSGAAVIDLQPVNAAVSHVLKEIFSLVCEH